MPDSQINLIKTTPEDKIPSSADIINGADFFHAWKLTDDSKLTKYFNEMGVVGSYEIFEIIVISYHRYLNGKEIDLAGQIEKRQFKKTNEHALYVSRLSKDSINGVYIPQDIQECMTELDRLMDETSKNTFSQREEKEAVGAAYGLGPGQRMRNNWGLWGGSRLQKYFLDKGVNNPEGMSWIILTCYHRYRNGKPLDFEKQIEETK